MCAIFGVIMLIQPMEGSERTLHFFRRDAVGEAEMPFAAKGVAWDEKEIFLLRLCAECIGIWLQAAREKIESAARLDALIAHLAQSRIEQIFIALIN